MLWLASQRAGVGSVASFIALCDITLENSIPFLPFPVLTNFQLCRVCHGARVARLIRMARREGPFGRAQTGGHDEPIFTASAQKTHGAFWHHRRRRDRSLIPTPNYATHTTPRARELIGAFLSVLSANIVHMKRVARVAFSSRWVGAVGLAQEAAKWTPKPKKK